MRPRRAPQATRGTDGYAISVSLADASRYRMIKQRFALSPWGLTTSR